MSREEIANSVAIKVLGYQDEDGIALYSNNLKVRVPSTAPEGIKDSDNKRLTNMEFDKIDLCSTQYHIHYNAAEYVISDMMRHLMIVMNELGHETINEMGSKFPHHTLGIVSEFTKEHAKVSKYRLFVLAQHGIIRMGMNIIDDNIVVSQTVMCRTIDYKWLIKRWYDLGVTLSSTIRKNVLSKVGNDVISILKSVIEVSDIIRGIYKTIDEELDHGVLEDFEEKFFKELTKEEKKHTENWFDEETSPSVEVAGSLLTGMPEVNPSEDRYSITLHDEVLVLESPTQPKPKPKANMSDEITDALKQVADSEIPVLTQQAVQREVQREVQQEEKSAANRLFKNRDYKTTLGKLTKSSPSAATAPARIDGYVNQYNELCDAYGNPLPANAPKPNGTITYVKAREYVTQETLPPRTVVPREQTQQVTYVSEPVVQQQQVTYGHNPVVQQQQQVAYGHKPVTQQKTFVQEPVTYIKEPVTYGQKPLTYGQPVTYIQEPAPKPQVQVYVDNYGRYSDQFGNPTDQFGNPLVQQGMVQQVQQDPHTYAKSSLINSLLNRKSQ